MVLAASSSSAAIELLIFLNEIDLPLLVMEGGTTVVSPDIEIWAKLIFSSDLPLLVMEGGTTAVGVPYSSFVVVTIRCGHYNNIFSLNMIKACLHFSSSLNHHDHTPKLEVVADKKEATACCLSLSESSDEEENDQDSIQEFNQVILKPPEKKQRAPTKYNQFIKEEIKRLKIEHPNMTHKQAFSAASKNWAHCPQGEYRQEKVHGCDEGDRNMVMHSTVDDEVHSLGNAFHI
ncbi:hypothetical protein C2S51_027374 [Perilla frutescens var. frutescens]|nr:hypothetical protein C2S51_027374 [Perilla frutescens var. frutescens]